MTRYVLSIDCGTTSVRSLAFEAGTGRHQVCASEDVALLFPNPGWVELDPDGLADATIRVTRAAFDWVGAQGGTVVAVGLTNMRETAIAWRRSTGQPVYPAILWMSQQSDPIVARWRAAGYDSLIRERTGCTNHFFWFGSKVAWLLDTHPEARKLAEDGDLAVGTVDSWLLYRLTGGRSHATDVSNGSRYQLMSLAGLSWDDELCETLGIPRRCLPELRPSESHFGNTDAGLFGQEVPITGIVADQQASLFGHGCEDKGDVKATFGTSGVVAVNAGPDATLIDGLVTSVAWEDPSGHTFYEVEGSAFHSGYTIGWLSKRLGTSPPTGLGQSPLGADERVYVLPSFSEMGAPRWPERSGAAITGLGMDTSNEDIMRAAVEAMAFQAYDLFAAMKAAGANQATEVAVDGGGAANDYLCQLLADLFGRDVVRPDVQELTSVGAAKAALRGAGEEAGRYFGQDRDKAQRFRPDSDVSYAQTGYAEWVRLVETVLRKP